jgi:hypothetical protein
MILDDIPNDTVLVKVSASSLCAEWLLKCQHDALHIIAIPHVLHPYVSKPHHDEILHHLFSKVVVNPI